MKKSKLSEPQIIAMLNEGETGVPIADLCRKCRPPAKGVNWLPNDKKGAKL